MLHIESAMDKMVGWKANELAKFVQKIGDEAAAEIIMKYKIDATMMMEIFENNGVVKKLRMVESEKTIFSSCINRLKATLTVNKEIVRIVESKSNTKQKRGDLFLKHSEQRKVPNENLVYLEPIDFIHQRVVRKSANCTNDSNHEASDQSKIRKQQTAQYPFLNKGNSSNRDSKCSMRRYYTFSGLNKLKNEKTAHEEELRQGCRKISPKYYKFSNVKKLKNEKTDHEKLRQRCRKISLKYYKFSGYLKRKNEKTAEEELRQRCWKISPKDTIYSTTMSSMNSDLEYIYASVLIEPFDDTVVRRLKKYAHPRELLHSTPLEHEYIEITSHTTDSPLKKDNRREQSDTSSARVSSKRNDPQNVQLCDMISKFFTFKCSCVCGESS